MNSIKLPAYLLIAAVICLPACSAGSDSETESFLADSGLSSTPVSNSVEATFSDATFSNANDALVLDDAVAADINLEFLRINDHLVECEGNQVGHCMLVQKEDSEDWVYFYDQIEGFEFEWGNDYEILVQAETVTPIFPSDSSLKYTLIEVLSLTQTTEEAFSYTSRNSQDRIVELAPQQFSLLGKKSFTCNADDCDNLRSAMAQRQATLLSFQHSQNPEAPLLLEAVLCADAAQSFTESCL